MLPLLVVVPFGPLLAWKRGDLFAVAQRLMAAFGGALAGDAGHAAVRRRRLGVCRPRRRAGGLADARRADRSCRRSRASAASRPAVALRRFAGLPRSVFGTALAHFGLGLTPLGIVGTLSLQTEKIPSMKPGETIEIAGYTLRFDGHQPGAGAQLHRGPGPLRPVRRGRRAARRDRLGQALLPGAADADDRGRHQDAGLQPALCLARRRRQRTARSSCASGGSRW